MRIVAIVGFCSCGLGARTRAEPDPLRLASGRRRRIRHQSCAHRKHRGAPAPALRAGLAPGPRGGLGKPRWRRWANATSWRCPELSAANGSLDSGARAENVLVVQAYATDTLRLGERTQAALAGAYYDVFQRRSFELPDFRSPAPSLRLDQGLAKSVLVSLGGGYRWFTFKPDDAYSFTAPTAFLAIRHTLPGDSARRWRRLGMERGWKRGGARLQGSGLHAERLRRHQRRTSPHGSLLGRSRRIQPHRPLAVRLGGGRARQPIEQLRRGAGARACFTCAL